MGGVQDVLIQKLVSLSGNGNHPEKPNFKGWASGVQDVLIQKLVSLSGNGNHPEELNFKGCYMLCKLVCGIVVLTI